MKRNDVDRRVLLITRVVLFIVGAVVGWLAMWQFLLAFPAAVRDGLKVVFEIIAAAVIAFALMLSARPIIYLGKLIAVGVARLAARLKPLEVVGLVLGIATGMMVAFLAYVLMSLFLPIIAVRVVLTVLVGFGACVGASVAFARGLTAPPEEEPVSGERYHGWILHASAFSSERLPRMLEWMDGPVYVLGRTIKTLIDGMETDPDALARYKELSTQDAFRQLESPETDETQAVTRLALTKRLRIVAASPDQVASAPLVKVLYLDAL